MNEYMNLVRMFGKVVGNTDKKSQEVQIATGKALIDAGYHTVLNDINKAYDFCIKNNLDTAEYTFEIANISRAVVDVLAGKPTGYLAKLDTKQSILTIQSCLLRDEKALELLLSDIDIYSYFMDKLQMATLTRKRTKKVVIPRGYGSEKGVIKKFTTWGNMQKAYEFFELYSKILPICDKFRQIMLDAWQFGKDSYHWLTPDLGECCQAVQEGEADGWKYSTFDWLTKNKGMVHENVYIPHKGGRRFGEKGTRSLGANSTHSFDAYILRELVRRCCRADAYTEAWFKLGKAVSNDSIFVTNSRVNDFYTHWKKTGIPSLRVLEFVSEGDNLPVDYYNAIGKGVRRLPEVKFDIAFTVHDEFACHIKYAHLMQQQFNYIISDIYQGHYLDYLKEAFEWETARWLKPDMADIELTPINSKTVEALESNTVILQ